MSVKKTVFDVIQPDRSNSSANRWFDNNPLGRNLL